MSEQPRAEDVLALLVQCQPGWATPRLDGALARVEPRHFLSFEQGLRRSPWHIPGQLSAWFDLQPKAISSRHSPSCLSLFSAHPNGRVREAALRAMEPAAQLSRWIFIRANDWVPAVAELACEMALGQLQRGWAPHWLPYLPLLFQEGRRRSFEPLQAAVRDQVHQCPLIFAHLIQNKRVEVKARRLALKLLMAGAPEMAAGLAANSDDVVMRSQYLTNLVQPEEVRPFLRDPVPLLRSKALTRLAQQEQLTDGELRAGLLDRARGVRETALYFCKKSRGLEFAQKTYREAPTSRGQLLGAPTVLEKREAERLCLQALREGEARFALAALTALAACHSDPDRLLWDTLEDPSSVLRRAAGRLLKERQSYFLEGPHLFPRLSQCKPEIATELLQLALHSRCPYTRVEALCRQLGQDSTSISEGEFQHGLLTARRMIGPYQPDAQKLQSARLQLNPSDSSWSESASVMLDRVFR